MQHGSPRGRTSRAIVLGAAFAATLVFSGPAPVEADTFVAGTPQGVRKRGATITTDPNGPNYYVGTQYFSDGVIQDEWNQLVPFDLTGVGTITEATFYSRINYVFDTPAYHVDLYGVGYSDDPLTLPDVDDNLFFLGELDGDATLIQLDYLTDPYTTGVFTGSSAAASTALVDFLNNRTDDIVWIRMNHDASVSYVGPTGNESYVLRFEPLDAPPHDPEDAALLPYLDLTVFIPPEAPPGTELLIH